MAYSKKEQLTSVQEKVHVEFTNYLTSVVGLKAPHHQTESLERRVQIFIRMQRTSGTGTCFAKNSQTPELYKGNSKIH